MICPHCLEETNGSISVDFALRLFGANESMLGRILKEKNLVLICDKCKGRWLVSIKIKI